MSELHLDSLEIKNFRCFEHLTIEKLGRVNLIVGKNSVGKTCLLEAIRIYATNANFPDLMWILAERGEVSPGVSSDLSIKPDHLTSLFYNMNFEVGRSIIQIGDGKRIEKNVSIKLEYFLEDNNNRAILKVIETKDVIDAENLQIGFSLSLGNRSKIYRFPLSSTRIPENRIFGDFIKKCVFVPCNGLNKYFLPVYWDGVVMDGQEDSVLVALRLLDSDIERFHVVSNPETPNERFAVVKTRKFDKPIRLRNLGDGMMRISGIAIAIVQAKNGYFLIDEFDNGLHHSIQLEAWRFIFRISKELNAQVFATTHSWDCVEAFQEAAAEDHNEEAMLIRLQQKRSGEGIEAVLYDEELLAKATRQQVEVR